LTNNFGNISLQESELSKVTGSGTVCLPSSPVRVDLINEAQLDHRLGLLGEMDMGPGEDRADYTLATQAATTDLIYSPSAESDSKYDREIYMVELGGELPKKTTEEIQREAEEGIAHAE
jgi:hypothetical protein